MRYSVVFDFEPIYSCFSKSYEEIAYSKQEVHEIISKFSNKDRGRIYGLRIYEVKDVTDEILKEYKE